MIDFEAVIVGRSMGLRRAVFRSGGDDPHQCCAQAKDGELSFKCLFSGIDSIEGRGGARVEDGVLIIRWCTADLSTATVLVRDEQRVALPSGTIVRFEGPKPECQPNML